MKTKKFVLLFVSLLLTVSILAACQSVDQEQPMEETTPAETPAQDYPEPSGPDQPVEGPGAYPAPVDEEQLNPEFAPQPGDDELQRGEVFISSTELLMLESYPLQVQMLIQGDLPTPCHELRFIVSQPDEQGNIEVEAYSLVDPGQICIQVMEPFEVSLSLGSYTEGSFIVLINGEQVEYFEIP